GHNDLAKNEALAASKRHLDEIVSLREELTAAGDRLREVEARASEAEEELRTARAELTEERRARKLAERLLREATEEPTLFPVNDGVPRAANERPPVRRGR